MFCSVLILTFLLYVAFYYLLSHRCHEIDVTWYEYV